jgi:hypothetical protein
MADLLRHPGKPNLCVKVVAGMVREHDRNLDATTIVERKPPTQKGVMDVNYIHGLEESFVSGLVAQGEIIACIRQSQARTANDFWFVILIFQVAKVNTYLVPGIFEGALIQVNVICDSTNIGFVGVSHHPDTHGDMLRQADVSVKDKK